MQGQQNGKKYTKLFYILALHIIPFLSLNTQNVTFVFLISCRFQIDISLPEAYSASVFSVEIKGGFTFPECDEHGPNS